MKKRSLLFQLLKGVPAVSPSPTSTFLGNTATQPAQVGNFNFMGCYVDNITDRVLNTTGPITSKHNDDCALQCAGFQFMGTEYGQECKR